MPEIEPPLGVPATLTPNVVNTEDPTEDPEGTTTFPVKPKRKGDGKQRAKSKDRRKLPDRPPSVPYGFFRIAHREQVELLTLVDRKASIALSINGLLLPLVLASASVSRQVSVSQIVAMGGLGLGCAISMLAAVYAVRPHRTLKGRQSSQTDLLNFQAASSLAREQYTEELRQMLDVRDDVFRGMSEHLHVISKVLARKFHWVRVSYMAFLSGFAIAALGVAVGAFVLEEEFPSITPRVPLVSAGEFSGPKLTSPVNTQRRHPSFRPLVGVYEPSAVVVLDDGMILSVDDERGTPPFSLIRRAAPGRLEVLGKWSTDDFRTPTIRGPSNNISSHSELPSEFSDLEGMASGADGEIFAITSHAPNSLNQRYPGRDVLMRFHVINNRPDDVAVYSAFRRDLALEFTELADAALTSQKKRALNVEGLAYHPEDTSLWLGLRTPLNADGDAYVVRIQNPDALFSRGERPLIAVTTLDLDGHGIRSLAHDPMTGGMWIAARAPSKTAGRRPFRLFFWSGDDATKPAEMKVEGMPSFERLEAVSVLSDGALLLMSDDGSKEKTRFGKYVIVPRFLVFPKHG